MYMRSAINTRHLEGTYLPSEQPLEFHQLATSTCAATRALFSHNGRIGECSAIFSCFCEDAYFLGKRRTSWKLNLFTPKLLSLIFTSSVCCLHRCSYLLLQCGPHREKCEVSTFLCTSAADTRIWHCQCPAVQTARSCIPSLIYCLCYFFLCRVWNYKHQDL